MEQQVKQDYLAQFGEGVKKFRSAAGFSQEELAGRAGIDRSYLGGIERGEHNLALINIIKIADALSLPPSELLRSLTAQQAER